MRANITRMYKLIKKKLLLVCFSFWKKLSHLSVARRERYISLFKRVELAEIEESNRMIEVLKSELEVESRYRSRVFKEYLFWKAHEAKRMKAEIGCCEKCQRTDNLTVDHIIPQDVLRMMGIDPEAERDTRNFRLLCKICNGQKANRLDFTDHRTKALLIEYAHRVEGPVKFMPPVYKKVIPKALKAKTVGNYLHKNLYAAREEVKAALEAIKPPKQEQVYDHPMDFPTTPDPAIPKPL